ncbi:MAG: hypothetical protein AAFU55_16255, partial [Pseudomonadota bacterium]
VIARGGAITDAAASVISVTGNAEFIAENGGTTYDIVLDSETHVFDADGADAVGDGNTAPDRVAFLGADVTIIDSGDLYAQDGVATGSLTLRSVGGGLTADRIDATGATRLYASGGAAGSITVTNLNGGDAYVGAFGGGAAGGDVSISNFTLDSLDVAGATVVELTEGAATAGLLVEAPEQRFTAVTTNAFTDGAATNFNTVTGSTADLLVLERMRFNGDIAITAGEIRVGHIAAENASALSLTATTGDIAKRADVDLDFTGASATSFAVEGARGAATATVALTAFDDLLSVGGDATLDAAGDVVLVRAQNGATDAEVDFNGTVNVTATGVAALEDVSGITLGDVDVTGDLAVRSNTDNSAGG